MITTSAFDEEFFGVPCFSLVDPVVPADLSALPRLPLRSPCFAAAKVPASDLVTARLLLNRGFRKICTQVELIHPLTKVNAAAVTRRSAEIKDALHLSEDKICAHASHFETSRFRQDSLLPTTAADALYAKWISNSLSGSKRVVCTGLNFCTFVDNGPNLRIDLLSVLDKRQGHARTLLSTLLTDARHQKCACVRVVTEAENGAALAAYRNVGFMIEKFINVFHFYVPNNT
jgi:hypothetical protein